MPPSTGYDLRFVVFRRALDVRAFEKQVTFEVHHSKKFRRDEKLKPI